MKLKMQGLPLGSYTAEFNEIEQTNHPEYGDGLAWKFTVRGGQFNGQQASRITGTTPTSKNACGRLLKGIAGRLPDVGQETDLSKFYGKRYQIIVEETDSGSTRVSAVLPATEGGV